jgi:hypothetical protein
MVDPIVGAVVAKTVKATQTPADQVTPGLLKSILGPPAREFGDALGRTVAYRTRNFGRIVEKANTRLHRKSVDGIVNIRIAYALLEEGSLCDDELMAEYLGGLLAASKSPGGRDDRAVTWTRIVTGLSSFQIRAHYLLYKELAARLHDEASDLDMSVNREMKRATLYLDLHEFETALMTLISDSTENSTEDPEAILRHSIFGLCRTGLLHDSWHYSTNDNIEPYPLLKVRPTGRGMELYGWALGVSDLLPRNFASRAFQLEIPTDIPRLESVELRDLHEEDDVENAEFNEIELLEDGIMLAQFRLEELREAEFRLLEAKKPSDVPEGEDIDNNSLPD